MEGNPRLLNSEQNKADQFLFSNCTLASYEVFFCIMKKCAKESFLYCYEENFNNKSLKFEKFEKLTYDISIWVKRC